MRLCRLCFFLVMFFIFHSHLSLAKTQAKRQLVAENFSYELANADIFAWIEGNKIGKVKDEKNNMAKQLERFILNASNKLSFAIYGLSKQQWLTNAIAKLRQQGVVVEAVVDQSRGAAGDWMPDNFVYSETAFLPQIIGVAQVMVDLNKSGERPRSSQMHNKFVVADDRSVWLGTTNLSHTGIGAEYNANNTLIVHSAAVARLYAQEFDQMFRDKRFSRSKQTVAPRHELVFKDNTRVSVYFSPQDDTINTAIIPAINAAKKSISIAMFYLTSKPIVQALCAAVGRNIGVKIILDAVANVHPSSPFQALSECGVDVKVENWGGKMHMKTAIIDDATVIVGSMNWSERGNSANDENTMVIKNNRKLRQEMQVYFTRLWDTLRTKAGKNRIRAEGYQSINSCIDGLDNDHDGLRDAQEWSCQPRMLGR
ncbi:MAG: phospholipase D-like domain-containing protein [Pseudomonadota bacterium]|nr:phospholipase D-like domain-containing protein [Pseudomonadota bacterium]